MLVREFDNEQFEEVSYVVEEHSKTITDIVCRIVDKYTADLDSFVERVKNGLEDKEKPLTTNELSNICMRLATYIYFASAMTEQLGIKDDISKAVYKEVYNNNRNLLEKGTVADKNTQAELSSQKEYLVNVIYSRSFRIVKEKVDSAQELLSSCKKVLTLRINELNLSKIGD